MKPQKNQKSSKKFGQYKKRILTAVNGSVMKRNLRVFSLLLLPLFVYAQQSPTDTSAISLSAVVNEALANNELLKKSAARLKAGQAVLQQAEGEMQPKIDANLSYGYLDIVPGFRSVILGNIEHDFFPTLSISQPLYTGGKLKHQRQEALAGMQSLEQAFLSEQLGLKLAVTAAYFQLQSLINQRQILFENRKQLETHRRYARLLVEAGHMSQLELNRIAVALAAVDGNLLRIDVDYQTMCNEMSLLLGRQEPQLLQPQDSLQVIPFEQNPENLLPVALEQNPIWKQLEWELRKAEARVRVQQAARMPQVSAQAYYGYEFGLESFSFDENKRYFWGLNVKMPIYDGKVIDAKIKEGRAGVEQIQWQREYLQKNLASQLQNGYGRLIERENQIAIQKQALEQAQQSYRLALIEYHAGRRSNTDLLDIQNALFNSRLTLNQAMLDYNLARAKLLAVMGIL